MLVLAAQATGHELARWIVLCCYLVVYAFMLGRSYMLGRLKKHHRRLHDEWVEAEAMRRGVKRANQFRARHNYDRTDRPRVGGLSPHQENEGTQ